MHELEAAVELAVAVLAAERATPEKIKEIENWASYEYNVGQRNSYSTFLDGTKISIPASLQLWTIRSFWTSDECTDCYGITTK